MAVPGRAVPENAPQELADSELFAVDAYLREFDATVADVDAEAAGELGRGLDPGRRQHVGVRRAEAVGVVEPPGVEAETEQQPERVGPVVERRPVVVGLGRPHQRVQLVGIEAVAVRLDLGADPVAAWQASRLS